MPDKGPIFYLDERTKEELIEWLTMISPYAYVGFMDRKPIEKEEKIKMGRDIFTRTEKQRKEMLMILERNFLERGVWFENINIFVVIWALNETDVTLFDRYMRGSLGIRWRAKRRIENIKAGHYDLTPDEASRLIKEIEEGLDNKVINYIRKWARMEIDIMMKWGFNLNKENVVKTIEAAVERIRLGVPLVVKYTSPSHHNVIEYETEDRISKGPYTIKIETFERYKREVRDVVLENAEKYLSIIRRLSWRKLEPLIVEAVRNAYLSEYPPLPREFGITATYRSKYYLLMREIFTKTPFVMLPFYLEKEDVDDDGNPDYTHVDDMLLSLIKKGILKIDKAKLDELERRVRKIVKLFGKDMDFKDFHLKHKILGGKLPT